MHTEYVGCGYKYWLHSMQSRVYVKVRASIRLSVPSIDHNSNVWRVCCWVPCRQMISIDSNGWRAPSSNGAAAAQRTAAWRSAAYASSGTFTAAIKGWTPICFGCMGDFLPRKKCLHFGQLTINIRSTLPTRICLYYYQSDVRELFYLKEYS